MDPDRINAYIDGFYSPLDEYMEGLRASDGEEYLPYIRKQTEMLMGVILDIKKPARILELGTATGYSAIYMAKKCPEAEIFTLERDAHKAREARSNVEDQGLEERVHVITGDCLKAMDDLFDQCIRDFDMVFIDAGKSHYRDFLDSALRIVKKGAVILSDDVFQRGITLDEGLDPGGKHRTSMRNMRDYLKYITEEPCFDTAILKVGDGLALTFYKGE